MMGIRKLVLVALPALWMAACASGGDSPLPGGFDGPATGGDAPTLDQSIVRTDPGPGPATG